MDVRGPSTANGAQIQQWDCAAGSTQTNQQFRFDDRGNGYYRLIAKHSSKCVDFNSSDLRNGGGIQQMRCNSNDNQLFRIESIGNSQYSIRNKASNRCIDSPYSNNGAILHQWDCTSGNNNQAFLFNPVTTTPTPPPSPTPNPSPPPKEENNEALTGFCSNALIRSVFPGRCQGN